MKVCTKCKESKELNDFTTDNRRTDGRQSQCRVCKNKGNSLSVKKNSVKIREYYCHYRKANKKKISIWNKKYRDTHLEKTKEHIRQWTLKNKERVAGQHRINERKRTSTIKGKLNKNIRSGMCTTLNGSKKGRHWETLVGFTLEELRRHLEKQFKAGMTWENYGPHWHIDHKIPISAFNFKTPEHIDFKRCWALENLQPLEAEKNIKKWAKLEIPFQPSLAINM